MQSAIIWFETDDFVDSDAERRERINETIGGAALAKWLSRETASAGLNAVSPWAEDHGWDFEVKHEGATYLIVCTIEDNDIDGRDACVQVHKVRPAQGKMGQLDRSDWVVQRIAQAIAAHGASLRFE